MLWPVLRRLLPDGPRLTLAIEREHHQLEDRVGPGRLRALGLACEAVRRSLRTRAHSVVARRPPANVVAALPLSVLDRPWDLVDALRQGGERRGGGGLERVSRGWALASHTLERAPLLRRGEDPSTPRPDGLTPWRSSAR